MGKDSRKALIQSLKKIPIFQGLSPSQVESLLQICTPIQAKLGQVIYAAKAISTEMHILVSGELSVVNDEGIRLARLYPVTTVGEMGLVSHRMRSASVEAAKASRLLTIKRPSFEALLAREHEMQVRIYRNIIDILASKIVGDNVRVREHLLEMVEHQRQLRVARRQAETLLRILVEETGMSEDDARGRVDARLLPQRMRVLVVDDEPAVCQLVRQALPQYDVDEAGDGVEALRAVQMQPPDLVITDIRMPHMDGTALLKSLRAVVPDLPIIAMSGYVGPEDVTDYDFDGFLCKPFQIEEFRSAVATAAAKAGS